ncbi:MAG: haloacid dehalogenase-like hydrolase, partial [Ruminococcaceae bacterium]|nr:haloacid dehalogenase-like hydrolase [Oscillospiraceae bacterium]
MSKVTTVLFDLDGTLLPMDQDVFIKTYFTRVAAKMAPRGYEPRALIDAIWAGTTSMVKNDGSCTNEQAFWATFAAILGEKVRAEEPVLRGFYENEFQGVQSVCGCHPAAAEIVRDLKARGIR